MLNDANDDQDLFFADDDAPSDGAGEAKEPWKVMIVDDDPAIHEVTLLALNGFRFAERDLEFIQCHSGAEAKEAIMANPDTALVLLDVVMESDHAGLEVAQFIREQAQNANVRIVLRTGQPGQAPERRVITDYDINDYKEKTELTASKLYTLMHAALRSFRDIQTIEASKRGLSQVIEASASISKITSMNQFASGVLDQMAALLHLDGGACYMATSGLSASCNGNSYEIIAGTGEFADGIGKDARDFLAPTVVERLERAKCEKANSYTDNAFLGFFESNIGRENLIYVASPDAVGVLEKDLVELFTRNVSIAFENIHLHDDLEATQREIVYMLGEAVETRSQETGNHVKRVAEISKLLSLEYGLDGEEAEIIKFASPLHDLGKIGIPDAILNKPGRHDDAEREIMQTHAGIGYNMLKDSKRRVLQAGAVIANEHHERWDGAGYPNGKKGEDIHIYGRITAVADVFDALSSDRCYKKAWPLDEVLELFKSEHGKQFDPTLIDLFHANIDKIENIRNELRDHG